jgi:hypothetical protein
MLRAIAIFRFAFIFRISIAGKVSHLTANFARFALSVADAI